MPKIFKGYNNLKNILKVVKTFTQQSILQEYTLRMYKQIRFNYLLKN